MASIASYLGISDRFAYSMTKGAVYAMTLSEAKDYIEYGIRCNVSAQLVCTRRSLIRIWKTLFDRKEEMFGNLSPISRSVAWANLKRLRLQPLCSEEAASSRDPPIISMAVTNLR